MADWSVQNEFVPGTIGNVCFKCKMDLRPESPTGQDGHEKALDTGINIDFEGGVAFCESCVIEAASLIGLLTPTQAEDLRYAEARAEAEAENLRRDLDLTLSALNSLRVLPASARGAEDPATVPLTPPARPDPGTVEGVRKPRAPKAK